MASHGISRTEHAQPRNQQVQEQERKKLKEYQALVAEAQLKRSEGDYTPATLELTSKLLKLNPEFYTIWNYRRLILQQTRLVRFSPPPPPEPEPDIPADQQDPAEVMEMLRAAYESRLALLLREELEFLVPLLTAFPKCYWIWNHRLWTLEKASALLCPEKAAAFWTKELALVGMMLTRDMRNFHGWMYRRIVVMHIENPTQGEHKSLVRDEFEYTSRMVRGVGGMTNYSAWHQRSVLIPTLLEERGADIQERMDFLEDELELLQRAIATDPEDQSLWFYHRWLAYSNTSVRDPTAIAPGMPRSTRINMLSDQIDWLKELLEGHPESKYILKALVLYVKLLQELRNEPSDDEDDNDEDGEARDEADENKIMEDWIEILERIDPMRKGRYKALRLSTK